MGWLRRGLMGVVVAGCVVAGRADALATGVVVESYVGSRPEDAESLLAPVLQELERRGYLVGSAAGQAFTEARSRPAGDMDEARFDALTTLVATGWGAWSSARYQVAAETLAQAIEQAQTMTAMLADSHSRRLVVQRAMVGLALALRRLGDGDGAAQVMAELIRTFPEDPLSRETYGSEAPRFYDEVRASLDAAGRGTLEVAVDEGVMVFLDESFIGRGHVVQRMLYPGTYRVFTRKDEVLGRVYSVRVEAGETTRVEVSWSLDAVLRTLSTWTGLEFRDVSAKEGSEDKLAAEVARVAKGTGNVVVLGIGTVQGRRSVTGWVIDLESGTWLDGGYVSVEPEMPTPGRLRELGRFLSGESAPSIARLRLDPAPRAAEAPTAELRWLPWSTAAVSVAAVGTGIGLLWLDGRCTGSLDQAGDDRCRRSHQTATTGIVTLTIGVAAGAVSGYLFWRGRDQRRHPELVIVPHADGALAQLRGEF